MIVWSLRIMKSFSKHHIHSQSLLYKTRKFTTVFVIMFIFFSAAALLLPQFRDSLHKAAGAFGFSTQPAVIDDQLAHSVFSDVPANHPQANAIQFLKSHGITQGYQDGRFYPEKNLTRGEFAKLMVTSKGAIPSGVRYSYCFNDVGNEWFAPYVCFAKGKGWVNGMSDGTFAPNENITSSQASTMLDNAFGLTPQLHGSADSEPLDRAHAAELLAEVLQKNK